MAKQYYFFFGNGNPASYTGLSPTFIVFNAAGVAMTPPGVTEFWGSGATGIYGFQCGSTVSAAIVIDGGSTLAITSVRYISGSIDPVLAIDQSIGYMTDSFGSTSIDPTTLCGKANRVQEFQEGNKVYNKSTGVWDIYSRGSSTLLREKALTNGTSQASSQ